MPVSDREFNDLKIRMDGVFTAHSTALNDHATRLADLAATPPTSRITELEKANNELAILVNQAIATLKPRIDAQSAAIAYTQSKLGEQANLISELFGDTPSKIADRITGTESSITELRRALEDTETRTTAQAKRDAALTYDHFAAIEQRLKNCDILDAKLIELDKKIPPKLTSIQY